jgi:hypothetical protein
MPEDNSSLGEEASEAEKSALRESEYSQFRF